MRKPLIFALFAFVSTVALAQTPNTLTEKEKKEGWKLLFDGTTTKGWHTYLRDTAGSRWRVQDGAIIFDPSQPQSGGGDLVTNDVSENYEPQPGMEDLKRRQ